MTLKKFIFDRGDKYSAFFAMYAGLRMYKEQKHLTTPDDMFSIPAGEAFCMLEDLKEMYPSQYAEAEAEYNVIYGKVLRVEFDKCTAP
jgi:hypothetical protein